MRRSHPLLASVLAGLIALSALFTVPALAAGPIPEAEPNNSCAEAQNIGAVAATATALGQLDGWSSETPNVGDTPNIDMFRLTAAPGSYASVSLTGGSSGAGTLEDPLVGVLSSDCAVQAIADYGGAGLDAATGVTVPADGVLIIAATSCCDYDLQLGGPGAGSYRLDVLISAPIGEISGRLVDGETGLPLAPDGFSPSAVELYTCVEGGCDLSPLRSGSIDEQGRFSFAGSSDQGFILGGDFRIRAVIGGYSNYVSPIFAVAGGVARDLGDIALSPRRPIGPISGRVVDSRTGEPLTGGGLSLVECDGFGCGMTVASLSPDDQGRFRFEESTVGYPLFSGSYRVTYSGFPAYSQSSSAIFTVGPGQSYDVGDLAGERVPAIGSVKGRLIDAVTGEPLAGDGEVGAGVSLARCEEFGCFYGSSSAIVDSAGRFVIPGIEPFSVITPGRFVLNFSGAQYISGQTEPFDVAEGQDRDLGDIPVQPFPLRMLQGRSCASIPTDGGLCQHSLRVINGQATADTIQVWSTITVSNPIMHSNSAFQPQSAVKVRLRPGQAREVGFNVMVPANVPAGTVSCVTYYLADDTRGFYFQPLNTRSGFCFVKEYDGSFRLTDAEEGRQLAERARGPAQRGGRPR